MTMTRPTTEQITHNSKLLSDVLSGFVTPEAFGAVGDGVTNDTAALQAALDTLKEVRGSPGKTYLVRRVTGTRYCLLWKSGMRWVGCGSTIKLGANEYIQTNGVSVIMAEGVDPVPLTVTTDTYFKGHIDGNSANQPAVLGSPSGGWFTPTVYVNYITRTEWDITISNGLVIAFYAVGSASSVYDNTLNATVYGVQGSGVFVTGTRWNIPYVNVRDATYINNSGSQGNSFVAAITDSTIGRIWHSNVGLGVKFDLGCENITIDSIVTEQGAGTSPQKAPVKFQGTVGTPVKNISVGNIVSTGYEGNGLYLFHCQNLTIGSYIGSGNGQDSALPENDRADTFIVESNEVTINSMVVDGCGQHPLITATGTGLNNVNIGTFTCIDTPNGVALLYNKSGGPGNQTNITFGSMSVRNEDPSWAARLNVVVGNANVYIGFASIDVPFSNYVAAGVTPISQDATGGSIRTGPITFRNTPTSGVVQLTNSSTTTAVPTAPAMTAANGINCAPIIKVEPVSYNNTSNSSVLMAGRFTASAGNPTTGGLTIRHPPIPSTGLFFARWTIEGYQAPGDCLEATATESLKVNTNATAAAIADRTNTVNLGGKHEGRMVWDTTNNRMMYASGSTDVSPWYVIDGSASVTPT